jgi:serine/threonine protein kinase
MTNRIHRDIKPENFRVMDDKVFILGFGSIVKYQDASGFLLLEKNSSFFGSIHFASISVHNCETCSLRDDLESMGYCLLALLCQ